MTTLEQKGTTETYPVIKEIEATKPLLFSLADQLVQTDPNQWNVLIGDDSGGRLPARFVRGVLEAEGRGLKTFFVTGSGVYRNVKGEDPYHEYFAMIQEQLGEPLRPLLVTESIGSGATIEFLKQSIAPYCEQAPEVAAVAVDGASQQFADYAGGIGEKPLEEVFYAYESATRLKFGKRVLRAVLGLIPDNVKAPIKARSSFRVQPPTPNLTVGISPNLASELPVASVLPNRNGALAARAFQTMDRMAFEYERLRHNAAA